VRNYAERSRIDQFLRVLGRRLRLPVRLYLVGGSIVVDMGLREATLDVDYVAQSDSPEALAELEQTIPILKNELQVNVEPASPADFLPVPANVLARGKYVRTYGNVSVYYYDLSTTIISKVARGTERDLDDAAALIQSGAVSWEDVDQTWREIRSSPRGWLRHDPHIVEARLKVLHQRMANPGTDR
jgi:hypothetical protein